MFVRLKKIGRYEYLYLVDNARRGGRHVQRVVKALGRRDEGDDPICRAVGLILPLVYCELTSIPTEEDPDKKCGA